MNKEEIDKWLDEEYGCSYTRLEELHDFYFEKYTDLKEENKQLSNNWEHIKHYINFWYERFNEHGDNTMASEYKCILNKIKELEEGVK